MTADTWTSDQIADLRGRIVALRKKETNPGRGGAAAAAKATAQAEKLERRVSRLLRDEARADTKVSQLRIHAVRLGRSKKPADRAELVLNALDELPAELALQVVDEATKRARARLGGGES